MNIIVRDLLNQASKQIGYFLTNLIESLISLLRIIILSRLSIAVKSRSYNNYRSYKDCIILANGPSLKDAFASDEVKIGGNDVFCVNMFVESEYFSVVKPKFYFLVDGVYFREPKTNRHRQIISRLCDGLEKVDWDMYLCISSNCPVGGLLTLIKNPRIKILRWNSTSVDGYRWFRNMVYSHRLGMPKCQTVTNFALMSAINMDYENVYLYGADHSWTRDLFVDNDNVVCYGDRHVYNTGLTVIKKKETMSQLLTAFSAMFKSHEVISEYATKKKCNIYNCTKDSFVDAYQRLK